MKYKNVSRIVKTFHGVTFQPGETKSVTNYINDISMIRVTDDVKIKVDAGKSVKSNSSQQNTKITEKKSNEEIITPDTVEEVNK